ncbi:GAF domain-containing protein [Aliidiomarina minuta]|uniref:GAF domain-containing protein n=1 Tax=Aliidiomarina minuta TaxID=880057 RepID=A0A432W6M1_9GAMM|nr:GAF domain-containing protein [Aliidiomarina minuta]RUO25720.1 GAF domain-containing protein [Aliidiomarina minuta]
MKDPNLYLEITQQAEALCADEPDLIANLANISALLYERLDNINWAGFYINEQAQDQTLVLGPFQGKVACVRIPFGQGVCGSAAAEKQTKLVTDVHAFPGHIACDAASNSEIVIPIVKEQQVVAVLDIDSPDLGRFNEDDQAGLEKLLNLLESLNWSFYVK